MPSWNSTLQKSEIAEGCREVSHPAVAVIMEMMHTKPNTEWPVRPIGELLRRVRQPVDVQPGLIYQEIGIRSHCKGIFHKPPTTGEEIGNKRVFWVKPGCLMFNIIFAWEQAVAMTSENEAGMIASHRFPMYTSRNGKLLPEYAWRYFSSSRGKYDLGIASPGGAGRNKTLGQAEFDQLKIPVPPIALQRMAIDTLAAADRAIARTEDLIDAKQKLKAELAERLLTGKLKIGLFDSNTCWGKRDFRELFVVADRKGRNLPRGRYLSAGRYPVVDQGELLVAGYSDEASLVISDVPLIVFGDHTRRVKFIDFPFICGADGTQLLQTTDVLDVEFGYQLLKNFSLPSLGYSRHMRLLKEQAFRIPEELSVQRRIVATLGSADRQVELIKRKLALQRQLKKGLMQKLLSGELSVNTG